MDRRWIDRYEQGGAELRQAIEGLSPAELNAFPVPGTWSIQQILWHMVDSDLIASDRMKRVIAEPRPLLIGYNETLFAQRLPYDQLDAQTACTLFALNRQVTATILRQLPDEAFVRDGVHNERGLVTLAYLVESYVGHLDHHLGFIRQKRGLLGKE